MSLPYTKLGLGFLFLGAAALSTAVEARKLGELDFQPCSLPVRQTSMTVSAQCATMKVPENPAQPKGRQIELALAWIPAKGEAEPDPLFMLAGGPGQSVLESYPSLHPVFADVIKKRCSRSPSVAVRSFSSVPTPPPTCRSVKRVLVAVPVATVLPPLSSCMPRSSINWVRSINWKPSPVTLEPTSMACPATRAQ